MTDNLNLKVDLSPTARAMVRLDFNPSRTDRVDNIKILTAALITECEAIRDGGTGAREAAIAIHEFEAAAMWAVKAATAGSAP